MPASPRRPTLLRPVAALAFAAALLAGCAAPPPRAEGPVTVRLLAFNDFHGHLEQGGNTLPLPDPANPGGPPIRVATGGAAHLAGALAAQRAGQAHTLTLTTGDLVGASPLASSLFRDEPTIAASNAMGVNLAVVGNHEFDRGLRELLRLVQGGCAQPEPGSPTTSCPDPQRPFGGSRFAEGPGRGWLAANVVDASGRPVLPATAVRSFGGVRVGFVGVVTRVTPTIVAPAGVAGLRFLDEAETLNRHAAELQAQGVQAIVALVHEGGETRGDWNDPTCPGARGPIFDIAAKLSPAIDVVFSAHSHTGYACRGADGRIVIQGTSFGRAISRVDLVLDAATGDVDRARTTARNLPVVHPSNPPAVLAAYPAAPADPAVQAIVDQAVALAAPSARRVVGRLAAPFPRTPDAGSAGDSPAGRLIADAQLHATRAADRGAARLALMNPGGIRGDFACAAPPCDLTVGQAFTIQPFGNSLVVMTLTGAQLRELLEQQATGVNAQRPRMLQPSRGLTYAWAAAAPPGQRVRDLTLDGRPVAAGDRVRVTVNSFLADGGDGFTVLTQGTDRLGGAQDLDALFDYLKAQGGPVAPDPRPRIVPAPTP